MIVVSNSTPLISLDVIGSLDLLEQLYTNINIPIAVYNEVVIAGAGRAGMFTVSNATWIVQHAVTNQQTATDLQMNYGLDVGESETIALAQELNADLILLDDLSARHIAKQLNLSVTGTIGVLLRAKDLNLIPEIKPLLDALLQAGIYIDTKLYQDALKLAGE